MAVPSRRGLAALALLAASIVVIATSSSVSAHRVLTPAEARDRAPGSGTVEVAGAVVSSRRPAAFELRGGGVRLRVRYSGVAPDGVTTGTRVTVTGRLRHGELIAGPGAIQVACTGGRSDRHC